LVAVVGWPRSGPDRRREALALGLRSALLLGLILSLAGLEIEQSSENLAVVFLLDHSDSMPPEARAEAFDYVRRAMQAMGPDDQAALVVFGGDALVEQAMSARRELPPISSSPDSSQTDMSAAMRLGLALFSPDRARRMVLLSDGEATRGDALQAAQFAHAQEVELLAVPFEHVAGEEVWLVDVEAPALLRQGERFDLSLSIEATQASQATVRVFADEALVFNQSQQLTRGLQTLRLPLTAGAPGFVRYRVQIESGADGYYQNNELSAFSQVLGPPRLLLVAPAVGESIGLSGEQRPDEAIQLVAALEASGFIVQRVLPQQVPLGDLAGLAAYNAVVLVDVPARQLSPRQMTQLQSYVRDLGGGLLAVGGPTSFGVGGYFRTPLEETLPVDMQIQDELRRPTLTIVYVIDRSGSMADSSGGAAKIELAKEAAARSVELLFPGDRVGVVAFDESASWVVPITEVVDPQTIAQDVGTLAAGGGTDILAGLQAVAQVLPADPAAVKHIILITDGGADPTGIPELVTGLRVEHGITLSAVGIGSDAAPFLADLAEWGGGRYHFAPDPGSIPSIFTEETALVARSYIVEERFYPEQVGRSPILSGITEVPPLHGYVATSAKDLARLLLISPAEDPILAVWQYGLGQAAAFTSDATGRWGREWVGWSGYVTFWSQVARAVTAQHGASPLSLSTEQADGQTYLTVEARAASGDSLNGLQLEASVLAPGDARQTLTLQQYAPGSYRAPFSAGSPGVYLFRVAGAGEGGAVSATAGWVMPYSPEYGRPVSQAGALLGLVQANGGRLADEDPRAVFAHTLRGQASALPVRPWALALAAFLLVLDIGVRRLFVSRADVGRAVQAVRSRLRRPGLQVEPLPARPARIQMLFDAKQRASPGGSIDRKPLEGPGQEAEPEAEKAFLAPAASTPEAGPEPAALAARLLARKRKSAPEGEEPPVE
jgi:Mg-chelatase subunit ChlD